MRLHMTLVLLFSLLAIAVLWGQTLRSQAELREQVLQQSAQRSLHLAEAMSGQMEGLFSTFDLVLHQLRALRLGRAQPYADASAEVLRSLPIGFVSHTTVLDAQGFVVFNSQGTGVGVFSGDRGFFQDLRDGPDRMQIGTPVYGRINNMWIIPVGLAVLRDGRFDGAILLWMPTEVLAQRLAALQLSPHDVVTLLHANGSYLARSLDNPGAMGHKVIPGRPYMNAASPRQGVYRAEGTLDQVPRTYGWHRMASGEALAIVGLADDSVLVPLAPTLRRGLLLTTVLSLLLLAGGGAVAWLMGNVERGRQATAASEERLKQAQRLAHVGNWDYDVARQRLQGSDEVYRLLEIDAPPDGLSLERCLALVHPDDRERVVHAFQQARSAQHTVRVEHRVLLANGTVKHVREIAVNEFEGDRVVRSKGTVQDITETRQAQQDLQQLNDELEKRVAERTRELAALNRELDTFAYSVSHDLRTPLRSIHGFASVMAEDADKLSSENRRFLRKIQESAHRMGVLITDLLSMASHSRSPARHATVNLSQLAHTLAAELGRSDPLREVEWQIEPRLSAQADPLLMRVVLQNLLGNAFKYTGRVEHAVISFTRTAHDGGMQTFCVRDNGAGFDMAYADQLFEPFKRLHKQDEFEGSGVGLATVMRVLQRHGGQIRGESTVGQGASFCFSLPDEPVDQGTGSA